MPKVDQQYAPMNESPDEWYARERAAFIAWWESEGEKTFGANPTLAAGAGWLAKAETLRSGTVATGDREAAWFEWRADNEAKDISPTPYEVWCAAFDLGAAGAATPNRTEKP